MIEDDIRAGENEGEYVGEHTENISYKVDEDLYEIVRYKFKVENENEVIKHDLALEEAQAHCQREDTHGEGWFDGYRLQED